MTEQLQLLPASPRLTDRQAWALARLQAAGYEGLTADEIGAAWCAHRGIHPADKRCKWDEQSGKQLAASLRAKGLAKYRRARGDRPGAWVATSAKEPERPSTVPYGEFPEGF